MQIILHQLSSGFVGATNPDSLEVATKVVCITSKKIMCIKEQATSLSWIYLNEFTKNAF